MKFSFKDFFNKCDQIRSFLRTWSQLLNKSLKENFAFYSVKSIHNRVDFLVLETSENKTYYCTMFRNFLAFINTTQNREFLLLVFLSVNFMETNWYQIFTVDYPWSLQSVHFHKIYWPEFPEKLLIFRRENKFYYHSKFWKFQKIEVVAPRCSVKKVFLEILQNSQENTSTKETLAQMFSCEFCEISKSTFSYRTPPDDFDLTFF